MAGEFPAWDRVYAFTRRWRANGSLAELLVDDRLIRWGYFSGDGALTGHEMSSAPRSEPVGHCVPSRVGPCRPAR